MSNNDSNDVVCSHISDSIKVKQSLLEETEAIASIANALCDIVRQGGKILCCGNGGSTCDAMHFAEELVARYLRERPAIAAMHLGDSATITCWANDYSFDGVFQRQVEAFGTSKDALLVFTTSGNSTNIIKALETANNRGLLTIALLGKDGGKAKDLASKSLIVKSNATSRIQEAHGLLIHVICELIETSLYPESLA